MEAIPRKYGEWSQFDRYCKLVLYHEAIDYLREMKCRRDREVSLDAVSQSSSYAIFFIGQRDVVGFGSNLWCCISTFRFPFLSTFTVFI